MGLRKPPKAFLIDSFLYAEYVGTDKWTKPVFNDPTTIKGCRIDNETVFSSSTGGKTIAYNALIFCYTGITNPLPVFKEQSKVNFDGNDHIILRVIPLKEAFNAFIYGYELEVI